MMADEENNQRNETIDDNIPEGPPEPPPPSDRPALPQNEPQDVKLKGERKVDANCNDALTTNEVDTSGVGTKLKKLRNAIERISKLPDHRVRGNSPRRVHTRSHGSVPSTCKTGGTHQYDYLKLYLTPSSHIRHRGEH